MSLASREGPAYKLRMIHAPAKPKFLSWRLGVLIAGIIFPGSPVRCQSAGAVVAVAERLETAALRVVVVDNEAHPPHHRAGYNGVSELRLVSGSSSNLFVPAYAGLNFEHIFSGDQASYGWNIFEPRRSPMQLVRLTDRSVELRQERTANWPLRSRVFYEANGDAIDFVFRATPLSDAWRKHGYIGIFFASYIQSPEDMSILFIGRSRTGRGDPRPRWIKHLPLSHGVAANHRPAGSVWDPPMDPGFNIDLVKGISDFEYLYPFYFGRSGENVFVQMFEPARGDGELRFAHSPSGGGNGNPAWDFVYFQRDYKVGREFTFRARAVYRKHTSDEEVVKLYEKWSGVTVNRPSP